VPDITREQLAKAIDRMREVYSPGGAPYKFTSDILARELLGVIADKWPEGGGVPDAARPDYYDGKGGMQPFDVIDAFGLDFYEGNVVKYLVRWRKKNGIEDLRKARTYLARIISRAEATDG
jgi:hypothetical protein